MYTVPLVYSRVYNTCRKSVWTLNSLNYEHQYQECHYFDLLWSVDKKPEVVKLSGKSDIIENINPHGISVWQEEKGEHLGFKVLFVNLQYLYVYIWNVSWRTSNVP